VLSSLRKFISWVFLKLVFGAFIIGASTGIYALWLFNHAPADFAAERLQFLNTLQTEQTAAEARVTEARVELAKVKTDLAAQEAKAAKAGHLAAGLQDLQTTWNRFIGNREQWKINRERIQFLRTLEKEAGREAKKLRSGTTRATVVLDRRISALSLLAERREEMSWSELPAFYYWLRAWWAGHWVFLSLAALYFVGPTLQKLGLYYHFAPRISKSRPLQISRAVAPVPWLGESSAGLDVALWPGEQARVRRRYLQSVEEGLQVKERLFLSWRFPFTSLLSGVVHDVDVRNVRAGRDYNVSFVHHRSPENQMAVVHVPEGGSLVVRPSFLAGVILPPGQKLRFRRRWRLFRWQAWLTGQLRFIEFMGPCRLVIAGRPGLRAERLEAREDGSTPTCRTALDKVIGFTPNLEYRLIRTARFWNYYRWNAMLFDATFTGVGFVLTQTSLSGKQPGLLSATRQRARRVLGL
jgi:hypothetical protein